VYFEAVSTIVALILIGRLLEARAKGRTAAAIGRLLGLRARSARVVRDGAQQRHREGEHADGERGAVARSGACGKTAATRPRGMRADGPPVRSISQSIQHSDGPRWEVTTRTPLTKP
jgi:hypothetical protein